MFKIISVKQWFIEARSRPLELLIGICIFSAAASGGAIKDVASTALAVMFIACLFYILHWPQYWRCLKRNEKLMLVGFAFYAFSCVLGYYNANDEHEYIKHLGRYIRFLLIIPVYLLLTTIGKNLFKYLLAGVIASGPVYLSTALILVPVGRYGRQLFPSGQYHHVVFGDMAMLNALFMIAVLMICKTNKFLKTALIVSTLCVLYVTVVSQARGAWLAMPFCLGLISYILVRKGEMKVRTVFVSLVLLLALTLLTPVKDMFESRVSLAVDEVGLFVSGEQHKSSIGNRLAMWHIATDVWRQYPFVGTGPGDFDEEILLRKKQGVYKSIAIHASTHNIYFQSLASTGTIGFVALVLALLILPFRLFMGANIEKINAASLSGLITVVAFAIFGLTASWILRAPVLSVYLVYVVTLSIVVSRLEPDSKTE